MLDLGWLTEERVPTQEELSSLNLVIAQAIVNMKKMHSVDVKTAFYALLILEFLMTAFEEGIHRVQEAFEKAMKEDPVLALMMMLSRH